MKQNTAGCLFVLSLPVVLALILFVTLAIVPAYVSWIGVVAVLATELMVINILRFYVNPREVRGNFKWTYLVYFSQKGLPQAQKSLGTGTSEPETSPTQPEDLKTLVGIASKPESKWILYFGWVWVPWFLYENFFVVFLTIFIWIV